MSALQPRGRRSLRFALAALVAGAIITIIGFILQPTQTFYSYLVAATYVVSVALGALILLMTFYCADATWPVVLRRFSEAIFAPLPVLAIAFIPIFLGMKHLYVWTAPDHIADENLRRLVEHKLHFLQAGFFIGRSIFYFVVWIGFAIALRIISLRQDRSGSPFEQTNLKLVSAIGLPAVGLTLSFASFDWIMSLEPSFYSTMFGVYYYAGGFIAAIALLTLTAYAAHRAGIITLNDSHYYALGRMMLAFTIFWGYIAFFQYLLVWIADKPDEARWYVLRSHGGWANASVVLIIVNFVVPFFALLPYRTKRDGGYLAVVSVWILLAHYNDLHWQIIPQLSPEHYSLHFTDLGAMLALGGLALVIGIFAFASQSPIPRGESRLAASLEYHSK